MDAIEWISSCLIDNGREGKGPASALTCPHGYELRFLAFSRKDDTVYGGGWYAWNRHWTTKESCIIMPPPYTPSLYADAWCAGQVDRSANRIFCFLEVQALHIYLLCTPLTVLLNLPPPPSALVVSAVIAIANIAGTIKSTASRPA